MKHVERSLISQRLNKCGKREQCEADSNQKESHSKPPAERFAEYHVPRIEARGAIDDADDNDQNWQMPVNAHSFATVSGGGGWLCLGGLGLFDFRFTKRGASNRIVYHENVQDTSDNRVDPA